MASLIPRHSLAQFCLPSQCDLRTFCSNLSVFVTRPINVLIKHELCLCPTCLCTKCLFPYLPFIFSLFSFLEMQSVLADYRHAVCLYLRFPNLKQFTHFHLSRIVDAAVKQNVAVDKKQVFQWDERLNITRCSVRDAPCNHCSAGQLLGSRPKPQNPPLSKASRPCLALSQPPIQHEPDSSSQAVVHIKNDWSQTSTPICALVEFPNTTLPLQEKQLGLLHSLIAVGLGMRFEG